MNLKKAYHLLKTTYHLLKSTYQIEIKMKRHHRVWYQNASYISLQIGRIFVFFISSKVSNLKSLSKICPRNYSFPAFEGRVSLNIANGKCKFLRVHAK